MQQLRGVFGLAAKIVYHLDSTRRDSVLAQEA